MSLLRKTTWRRLALSATLLLGLTSALTPAQAGVLQEAGVVFQGADGTFDPDTDEVFELASGDITDSILASVGAPRQAGGAYLATASAGVFGQIGLNASIFLPVRGGLDSHVLVASDEFVNVLGGPVAVQANFVIDGGTLVNLFGTNTRMSFSLDVGAENLGSVGPVNPVVFDTAATGALGIDFSDPRGGSYRVELNSDATGALALRESVRGGLDLGATLDAGTVEIPFSLQSLDLGVLLPGERLLLAYRANVFVQNNGITEGMFATFSDPFNLSTNSILASVSFTPLGTPPPSAVPGPGTLPLLGTGLVVLALTGRRSVRSRQRRSRATRGCADGTC